MTDKLFHSEDKLIAIFLMVGGVVPIYMLVSDHVMRYNKMTFYNSIAMPLLSSVLIIGAIFMFWKNEYKPKVLLAVYIISSLYFHGDLVDIFLGSKDKLYSMMLFGIFMPIIYLISHFCVPKQASKAAWTNYFSFVIIAYSMSFFISTKNFGKTFDKALLCVVLSHLLYLVALHFIVKMRESINESKIRENTLNELLNTDHLTQINNRHYINTKIEEDNKKCKQGIINNVAVFMIDIDFFKKVNDTFGHDVGDKVLKETAIALSQNIRKTDHLGRWGGEEFIALIKYDNQNELIEIAERIKNSTKNIFPSENSKHITLSIGISLRKSNEGIYEISKRADNALYSAKQNGRDQYVFYE